MVVLDDILGAVSSVLGKTNPADLESYFKQFRNGVIGVDQNFDSVKGRKKMIYADWTASGRLYAPIESKMSDAIGPFVANTHTETSVSGASMTKAYHEARAIIKKHVNASDEDALITTGTGMTGAINKLHRLMGLRVTENLKPYTTISDELRPVVFVSHMEHHSNQTSWLETIARVVVMPPDEHGLISLGALQDLLIEYEHSKIKIAAITACSNVTGVRTNYHEIARLMHKNDGLCFVDFACSAPYVQIDMHPVEDEHAYLDAIFFSPHKFLGGPGSSGVLIFNKKLYKNGVPDHPGGGTVTYTNPWGVHDYIDDIEAREDGGTPGFLQAMRIALSIQLKEKMGVKNILDREHELNERIFERLTQIKHLFLLAPEHRDRLGIFSFYIENTHYNLVVKLLNDRFGIQTRGGCSCAGTYGHYLLNVDEATSRSIEDKILSGCLLERPGWVRMSIHPIMSNSEVDFICDSIAEVAKHYEEWKMDYTYDSKKNEFVHSSLKDVEANIIKDWFVL